MSEFAGGDNVLISEYEQVIAPTDRFSNSELTPILLGIFGEVGSVMSTSKKLHREKRAFAGYERDVEEELGDTLWYLAALCRRFNLGLSSLFMEALSGDAYAINVAAGSDKCFPVTQVIRARDLAPLDIVLLRLGESGARLLSIGDDKGNEKSIIMDFIRVYVDTVQASGVSFASVLSGNISKACGRFLSPDMRRLPDFDNSFSYEEQLPREFEIEIQERSGGRCYLRWNGVFIGNPLLDNILDGDGYRFHDVFHLSYAAILHWSPTFRALIKHKRKSNSLMDESQDSGRAIVVEEGLSAYIFSHAKQLNYFKDQNSVSFDLLKSVQKFTRGYEVEACPLKLWEIAILKGYEVFRNVRENNGGVVVGNRAQRSITYRAISER